MDRREFLKSATVVAAIVAGVRPSTIKSTIKSIAVRDVTANSGQQSTQVNFGHTTRHAIRPLSKVAEQILQIDVDIEYAVAPTAGHPTNVWLVPDDAESQNEWRYVGSLISEGKSGLQYGTFSVPYYSDLGYELCVTDFQQPAQVTTHVKPIEFEIH